MASGQFQKKFRTFEEEIDFLEEDMEYGGKHVSRILKRCLPHVESESDALRLLTIYAHFQATKTKVRKGKQDVLIGPDLFRILDILGQQSVSLEGTFLAFYGWMLLKETREAAFVFAKALRLVKSPEGLYWLMRKLEWLEEEIREAQPEFWRSIQERLRQFKRSQARKK